MLRPHESVHVGLMQTSAGWRRHSPSNLISWDEIAGVKGHHSAMVITHKEYVSVQGELCGVLERFSRLLALERVEDAARCECAQGRRGRSSLIACSSAAPLTIGLVCTLTLGVALREARQLVAANLLYAMVVRVGDECGLRIARDGRRDVELPRHRAEAPAVLADWLAIERNDLETMIARVGDED